MFVSLSIFHMLMIVIVIAAVTVGIVFLVRFIVRAYRASIAAEVQR